MTDKRFAPEAEENYIATSIPGASPTQPFRLRMMIASPGTLRLICYPRAREILVQIVPEMPFSSPHMGAPVTEELEEPLPLIGIAVHREGEKLCAYGQVAHRDGPVLLAHWEINPARNYQVNMDTLAVSPLACVTLEAPHATFDE